MTRLLYPSKALGDWIEVDVGAISDDEGRRYTPKDVEEIEGNLEEHFKMNASTSTVGHVKLNDSLTSTSKTEAATADALRRVSEKVDKATPPDATTSRKGIVQLNNSLISTSQTQAATPYAVKQVNDRLESEEVKIGKGASVDRNGSIAIGKGAMGGGILSPPSPSIAIGENARSIIGRGVAIGKDSKAQGFRSVALEGEAKGNDSVAILGVAGEEDSVAILGYSYGRDSVAIGKGAIYRSKQSVSIGNSIVEDASYGVAIGEEARVKEENNGTAIGAYSRSYNGEVVLGGDTSGTMLLHPTNTYIPGSLTVKRTKNFEIPHPREEKKRYTRHPSRSSRESNTR